jgi:endonuclease/exonuclease/phosphatase family metal-dependent hydrolase
LEYLILRKVKEKAMQAVATPTQLSEQQRKDIRFWSRQFLEHCLFIGAGLSSVTVIQSNCPNALSSALPENQPQISAQQRKQLTDSAPRIDQLHDAANELVCGWTLLQQDLTQDRYDVDFLTKLISSTTRLKKEILLLQKQGVWVGYLFPSFIEHLQEEMDYFGDKFSGKITREKEISFWVDILADHVTFTGKLIDNDALKQLDLSLQALQLAQEGYKLNQTEVEHYQMVLLSSQFNKAPDKLSGALAYLEKTDNFLKRVKQDKPTNILHPMLEQHVERENRYGIERLKQLRAETAQIAQPIQTPIKMAQPWTFDPNFRPTVISAIPIIPVKTMQPVVAKPSKQITMLTYNIWRHNNASNLYAILALLKEKKADVIGLQEVTEWFFKLLTSDPYIKENYFYTTPETFPLIGDGEMLLIRKGLTVEKVGRIKISPETSQQQRYLIYALLDLGPFKLAVGTVHLESIFFTQQSTQVKGHELLLAAITLKQLVANKLGAVVLMGDTNLTGGNQLALENKYIQQSDLVDLLKLMYPKMIEDSTNKEYRDRYVTWDKAHNRNIKHEEYHRPDRIFVANNGLLKPVKIDRIINEYSDHFGLIATFSY